MSSSNAKHTPTTSWSWIFFKYFGSIIVIALSGGIAYLQFLGRKPPGISIHLDAPPLFRPVSLPDEQIQAFERDGAILIKNLLNPKETEQIKQAIARAPDTFSIGARNYNKIRFDIWRIEETIANLALKDLPNVAAQLLPGEPSFRLLRDAFFSYAQGGAGCGWHVDDGGFWPTQNDTGGVTLWLALDDMTGGGGLALANRTYLGPDTIAKCRDAIEGKTCAMATASPECEKLMENAKIEWDVKAGDAIVWSRWVFHRTIPVNLTLSDNEQPFQKQRYSVRYIPSNARAHGVLHSSIKQGETFDGSPYYPQVKPNLVESETKALEHGLDADVTPMTVLKFMALLTYKKIFG